MKSGFLAYILCHQWNKLKQNKKVALNYKKNIIKRNIFFDNLFLNLKVQIIQIEWNMMTETVVTVEPSNRPPVQAQAQPQKTSAATELNWLKFNIDYYKTIPGILKLVQLVIIYFPVHIYYFAWLSLKLQEGIITRIIILIRLC